MLTVLTNRKSLFGLKMLNALRNSNLSPNALFVIKQPASYYLKLVKYVIKRVGLFDAVYFSLGRCLKEFSDTFPTSWDGHAFISKYEQLSKQVFSTNGTNSEETMLMLTKVSPAIVLLGQTGIVSNKILEIPSIGTLNAHPGVLPNYRGLDCFKWAILNDDLENIGVAVHWVDCGIDTGPIIAVKKYSLMGDETLEILEERLEDMSIQLMISIVSDIVSGKRADGISQDISQGQQCYKMGLRYEKMVRKKLARLIGAV